MRVLYVVHALPAAGLGGTEFYTQRLAEAVAGAGPASTGPGSETGHQVAVATPAGHEADVEGARVYALPEPADQTDATGRESGVEGGVVDRAVERRFAAVVDDFEPDVVHLQHLKSLSATLPARCVERDVPCLATLHDFWTICHREQLLRPSGALCVGPESVAKCADCYEGARERALDRNAPAARERTGEGEDHPTCGPSNVRRAVERRTAQLEAALAAVDLLVAPSEFLRERFVAFGTPPGGIVHRRNGVPVEAFQETRFDPSGTLRFGYAGRVARVKGVHVLLSAFEGVEGDVALDVFGRFDPSEDGYHARLRAQASDRVTFHGRYGDASTPFEAVDVLVVPSLWYENSPLVIQEAFASGVPVVAGDVGGMAELVDHGEDGLTVPVGDAGALRETLQGLANEPETVARLRESVEPPPTLSEHAGELLELYEQPRASRAGEAT